jgi:chromatin remodeling complex protein RSC6
MPPAQKPRKTKTTTTSSSSSVSSSTPSKTVKETKVVEEAPVTNTLSADTAVSDKSADPNQLSLSGVMEAFSEVLENLTRIRQEVTALTTNVRALQKRAEREIKTAYKSGAKKKRKTGTRAPSGFVKPTLISDQLADFLGMDRGSELARTDVTREINQYIRQHSLQDPENGRKINPDTKLKRLLALKPSDELTYFNLQRYMSPHFAKANQAVPLASSQGGK